MRAALNKLFAWFLAKLAICLFLVVSLTCLGAMWIFVHDELPPDASRERFSAELRSAMEGAESSRAAAVLRRDEQRQRLAALRERAARAGALADSLEETRSWWRRWVSDRDQQRLNASRMERLRGMSADAEREARRLALDVQRTENEVRSHDRELHRISTQLSLRSKTPSAIVHYLDLSLWRFRWYLLAAVLLDLFLPTFRLMTLYYLIAPRVARGRAVRLAATAEAYPWLSESNPRVETALWPGEVARVRSRYLADFEPGVQRRRLTFLSWRLPLTSLLAWFIGCVELRNGRAGAQYQVALEDRKNPANELAVVNVPPGGSLVVRPTYVVGIVYPLQSPFRLRRRWQLFRWQSWVTGQFRHFEFAGPCRLIIAGRRGLRAERLFSPDESEEPSLRTSQDRTIGFTPNLDYRLIRTPRFWNYYRGEKMLFDAHFAGNGFVLTRSRPSSIPPRGFWAQLSFGLRDRSLKLLGL